MIGEIAFKGFCDRALDGEPVCALFITPNVALRHEQIIAMSNIALERKLSTFPFPQEHVFNMGPGVVYLRVAHRFLHRAVRGVQWDFIHGLEYVETLEGGEAVAQALTATLKMPL